MITNPLLQTDGYKTSHHKMYPVGTTTVYSNFTPRSVKYMPKEAKPVVVFGSQYVFKYIQELYKEHFFSKPKQMVITEAKDYLSSYLSTDYDVSHFEALYDLGYLPIRVKSLPEGSVVTQGTPIVTIVNTHPDFFWLTNFLETLISSLLWKPLHSASLAFAYKKILTRYALETDKANALFCDFQGHDFSFRGMQHPESAISSGLGFLTSFKGTDTIPALQAAYHYYYSKDVGFSVPASEHAVMTAYGKEEEIKGFKRLMKQYPTGILSVVSDSFDLWEVCTKFITELKDEILSREGKLVIRPDSGDPVDIICGTKSHPFGGSIGDRRKDTTDNFYYINKPEDKGVIELLWDTFGGTVNEQGYKVLDPHIGTIYGDSITLERAEEICKRLKSKGFASTNIVFGVGSYSLGYATRDNQGGAVKATYCEVNGESRDIYKDPVTDDGTKKSLRGRIAVFKDDRGDYTVKQQCTEEEEKQGILQVIYEDGVFYNPITLTEIRERIKSIS
jgi:nicotinamide phosphoribosyltransferase